METKNFNEFFEELNDMANFKNFGEKPETEDEAKKEFIQNFAIELTNTTLDERERIAEKYYEEIAELQQENAELKAENERLKENDCEQCKHLDLYIKYKQALQEIKAIAKTGMHCEGMGCDFMPKILDLITKAEEE